MCALSLSLYILS